METLKCGDTIKIPADVAMCPYCGGELIAQPTAWEADKDGSWYASEPGLDCMSEPELEEDDSNDESREAWDDWTNQHTYMPYVYWLPVDVKVQKWMKERYRFLCDKSV